MNPKKTITFFSIAILAFGISFAKVTIATDQWMIPNEVVKQVLQNPKLRMYLHPEVQGRVPVVIQSNFVDPKLKFILYGKPVIVVQDSKEQIVTNIYFSFFQKGDFSISYPVEGVKGTFSFVLDDNGYWKLKYAKVWEE